MHNLIFTANVVAPVFLLVFVGIVIKRIGIIDDRFCRQTSKFVFNVAMPSLVFTKLATSNYGDNVNLSQIGYIYIVLILAFGLAYFISLFFTKDGKDRGAFIHGSFRGNFAIMGLALINNAFGAESLAKAALVLIFLMPVYNVLGVLALALPMHKENGLDFKRILLNIITNPLIITVIISAPFSLFKINIPTMAFTTMNYLASLTLPLALISIGGSLSFKGIKDDIAMSLPASIFKIVLMPFLFGSIAVLVGFRNLELAVLFFLFAGPAAIASFPMATAMGANDRLASHIILISTLGSIFTMSLGVFILKTNGLF
jgi:malonate transporter and related proteins